MVGSAMGLFSMELKREYVICFQITDDFYIREPKLV